VKRTVFKLPGHDQLCPGVKKNERNIVNASNISVFKHKLEFVDFNRLCACGVHIVLCVSLFSYFLVVGHASVSFRTCVQTFV